MRSPKERKRHHPMWEESMHDHYLAAVPDRVTEPWDGSLAEASDIGSRLGTPVAPEGGGRIVTAPFKGRQDDINPPRTSGGKKRSAASKYHDDLAQCWCGREFMEWPKSRVIAGEAPSCGLRCHQGTSLRREKRERVMTRTG